MLVSASPDTHILGQEPTSPGHPPQLLLALPDVWINSDASNSLATAGSGDLLCGIISGLVAQKMKIDKSVLAAVCIQNDLSNRKKNVVVEDFLKDIQLVMNTIKNNN